MTRCVHRKSAGLAYRRSRCCDDRLRRYNKTYRRSPVHYGPNMQPDRWGSQTELLLFPIIMLACVALMTLILH